MKQKEALKPLPKEVLEGITKYLGARLGKYGVRWHGFRKEEKPNRHILTHEIKGGTFGIFDLIIDKAELNATVYPPEDKEACYRVGLDLHYEHPQGGFNGYVIPIRFSVGQDGEVREE